MWRCISASVHDQVRNKLNASYQDLGDDTVKNVPDQVRVYRVQPSASQAEHSAETPPVSRPRRLRKALLTAGAMVGSRCVDEIGCYQQGVALFSERRFLPRSARVT